MTKNKLIRAYAAEVDKCVRTGIEHRYYPQTIMDMLHIHGALETSRRLIKSSDIQKGLIESIKLGLADYTVEALVLKSQYVELFNETEREAAKWRLRTAHEMIKAGTPGTSKWDHERATKGLLARAFSCDGR